MTRIFWIPLGLTIALLSTFPLALAEERFWLVTEPSEGMPTCEEFFDKWEVPGAPAGTHGHVGVCTRGFRSEEMRRHRRCRDGMPALARTARGHGQSGAAVK